MKKKPIKTKFFFITIALLFSTPAWASEVDGNSFLCLPDKNAKKLYAIEFKNGQVRYNSGGADVQNYYYAGDTSVNWAVFPFRFEMNRKNLKLKMRDDRFPVIRYWQCKFEEFSEAILTVRIIADLRKREAQKGNKF